MSDKANFIIQDILTNRLPRVKEGLEKGYIDENQILFIFDHAVRARVLKETPEPLDEDAIANKQDEAWLEEIAKQWTAFTGDKLWETRDDIQANISTLFDELTRLRTALAASELGRERLKEAILDVEHAGDQCAAACGNIARGITEGPDSKLLAVDHQWQESVKRLTKLLTQPPSDVLRDALGPIEHKLECCLIASCDCLTKTPEVRFHKEDCHYRLLSEALKLTKRLREGK